MRQALDPAYIRLATKLHPLYRYVRDSRATRRLYGVVCAYSALIIAHVRPHAALRDVAIGALAVGCVAALGELAATSGAAYKLALLAYRVVSAGRTPYPQTGTAENGE